MNMLKRTFLFGLFFLLIFKVFLFAQNIERVTYLETRADGNVGRTITVNAVFIAWEQLQTSMEGNYRVIYQATKPWNGDWGDWSLKQREPFSLNLRQQYDMALQEYYRFPNMGAVLNYGDVNVVRIVAIPTGHTIPLWWGKDGSSYFMFFKMYMIID
jgi:hypothetical protein